MSSGISKVILLALCLSAPKLVDGACAFEDVIGYGGDASYWDDSSTGYTDSKYNHKVKVCRDDTTTQTTTTTTTTTTASTTKPTTTAPIIQKLIQDPLQIIFGLIRSILG
ncbi:ELMO domain-containing protein C-like [Physella acuta]|uniref:ELMO domain-containing protein C-like n=1 Tax=Physella acuta TaxID=109671 RepID=UPI0027DDA128|nr:ELMO domain-containing protein C-like [Physella acuta]